MRTAGNFYLTGTPGIENTTPNNGHICMYCYVMKEVLSSAAEAELGALFHNCCFAI
jgi:hypothetical protein